MEVKLSSLWAVPDSVEIDAGEIVGKLAVDVGGGGPSDFAQGGGPNVEELDRALEYVSEILQQQTNV